MGIISYEMEVSSLVPATKMFKALLDSDNITPKVLPQVVESIEIIVGDGGPGTIKKINFAQGRQLKYMLHQIDGVDIENMTYNYSVIEGNTFTKTLEKISTELKIVASPGGGCVCRSRSKYYIIGDDAGDITEKNIREGKEKALGIFRAIEAYILAENKSLFQYHKFLFWILIFGIAIFICSLVLYSLLTYELEISSPIPVAKIFKAFVLDADTIIPKALPHAFSSVEILEGDGEVGTIKKINFSEGSPFKYVKHQIDSLDKENFKFGYSVIGGDALMSKLEKISTELTFEALSDGGSVRKSTSKYYTIGDVEMKEEEIKEGKERASFIFKAVEAYLLANPDAY